MIEIPLFLKMHQMNNQTTVLVLGGYGFFGQRLVKRLIQKPQLRIIIAGRSLDKAEECIQTIRADAAAALSSVQLDASSQDLAQRLKALSPDILVNASGPFQAMDYTVASACIDAGVHYIDLADGREFVTGITTLHERALQANVLIVSGASSVPALSSAVVDHLSREMSAIESIDMGINPGNRTDRGLSTVKAILSYCGQPLPYPSGQDHHAWLHSYHHDYDAPVGRRLLSACDVPDLALFPDYYPGRPSVRFGGGLELPLLHRGMNIMALLAKWGIVSDWGRYAPMLKSMSEWFLGWGTDAGAMHVVVQGRGSDHQTLTREWQLTATHNDGPYVPTLAASALIDKFAQGSVTTRGAMPCMGLLTLDDFLTQIAGLHITTRSV